MEYNGNIVKHADSVNYVYRNIAYEIKNTQFLEQGGLFFHFGEIIRVIGSATEKDRKI
jgi:hypothetical protein